MSLFDRGDSYRLSDRKEKKKKEPRRYKPPRPLSWLGCLLLLFFALLLLFYGGALLTMRFAGKDAEGLVNTRLGPEGEILTIELQGQTTNVSYTYTDDKGVLHQGSDSLIGNEEPFYETIPVRYLPLIPGWSMLRFRTQETTTPILALFLGVILLYTGINRLVVIRRKALGLDEDPEKTEEQKKE